MEIKSILLNIPPWILIVFLILLIIISVVGFGYYVLMLVKTTLFIYGMEYGNHQSKN